MALSASERRELFADLLAANDALRLAASERQALLGRIFDELGEAPCLYDGHVFAVRKVGTLYSVNVSKSKARVVR